MHPHRLALLATLCALPGWELGAQPVTAGAFERENNAWPFFVDRREPSVGNPQVRSGAGPLVFRNPSPALKGGTASGFRPFWVQINEAGGDLRAGYILYPLFSYTQDDRSYKWSLFELVRKQGARPGQPAPASAFEGRTQFEVFPFWFSRVSDDPDVAYRAFFPFHGTVRNRLGFDRLSWTLFPFYAVNEKSGTVTTSTPWPIVRTTRGAAQGRSIWPFYGTLERPGVSSSAFYLWPFGFTATRQPSPDDPPGTAPWHDFGVLPFYASRTGPGFVSKSYAWPFFGYTERTEPVRYSETRYFWPFFVQGRGDSRQVNRWAPFFTHSIVKGYEKHWLAWPLLRRAQWTDEGVDRARTQLLYFLYWHERQTAAGRTHSPAADLVHVWPFMSAWDNGAGRRQWQLLSPLEVFFPGNAKVRQVWSPLFAVARHDQRAPGNTRTSLLWDLVTWEHIQSEGHAEFHLGPLLGVTRSGQGRRVAFGRGLFGFQHSPERGWRPFWLAFPARRLETSQPSP